MEANKKIGILDSNWTLVSKPVYDVLGEFNQYGIASGKQDNGYRLVSARLLKSSKHYEYVGAFNNYGVAVVRDEAKRYGLIDTSLKVVLEPSYYSIGFFNESGMAPACKFQDHCGIINLEGKEVLPSNFADVSPFNKFGLTVVSEVLPDCKSGACKVYSVYDKNGKMIMPKNPDPKFSYRLTDSLHADQFIVIIALENEKPIGYHLIDVNTSRLISPVPYEMVTAFDVNGVFRVRKDALWGLMDTTGKLITRCIYKEIRKVSEGYYAVRNQEDRYGFIDKKGKAQIPFEYDEVKFFRGGHAIVSKGKEKWGLINRFNAKIIPCVFKSVSVSDSKYELFDETNTYTVNDKGDCEQNCQKFEEIRKKANQAIK